MCYIIAAGRLEKVGIVSPGTLRASLLIHQILETFDGPFPPDCTPNFIPNPTEGALLVFRTGRKVATRQEKALSEF